MTTPIILDCDPGNDDAVAILAAAGIPRLELLAITTRAGHLEADRTARNAAIAAAAASLAIPVAAGAAGPLVRPRLVAGVLDLALGLDRERTDLKAVSLEERHSSTLIAEIVAARPGVTIVCTGPLTNLALAVRQSRSIVAGIGRIVSLGGAWVLGNKTAAAEWNILSDPEATSVVYASGAPNLMIPIDATAEVGIDDALVRGIAALQGEACALAAELLESLLPTHRSGPFGPPDAPLNDPLAILIAATAELARTLPARVDIETPSRFTYGRSVVDFSGKSGLRPNCEVVVEIDAPLARAVLAEALAALAGRQGDARSTWQQFSGGER